MNLRTSCQGCVFAGKNTECGINRPVYLDEYFAQQSTDGFCFYKRDLKWSYSQDHIHGDVIKALATINKENSTLSAIIVMPECNLIGLNDTITDLNKNTSFLKEVIVITQNIKPKDEELLLTFLTKNSVFPWKLEKVLHERPVESLGLLNYAGHLLAKGTWFLGLEAGDCMLTGHISLVEKEATNIYNQKLMFYFDLNDPVKCFYATQAFKELQGHSELPLIDKLKTFDNWESVCQQIISK